MIAYRISIQPILTMNLLDPGLVVCLVAQFCFIPVLYIYLLVLLRCPYTYKSRWVLLSSPGIGKHLLSDWRGPDDAKEGTKHGSACSQILASSPITVASFFRRTRTRGIICPRGVTTEPNATN